jgi:D-hydroxyproline dehydrogenase subunit alpha
MNKEITKRFDVLVVGGGPAGISAALSAAKGGAHVGIVDDNPSLGGQIWRGEATNCTSAASRWINGLSVKGVDSLCAARVIDLVGPNTLLAETADQICDLSYRKLVLATGARERFLPFPGWTLPNVMGAGALQALVKSGLPVHRKRVVVAGTGPLLLAVASCLRKHGAEIVIICEQASRASLARFSLSLLTFPQKISQALSLRKDLSGIRFVTDCWPAAAIGDGVLEQVTLARGNDVENISCDYLACGFHLVPNTELPSLLGCRLRDGFVEVDDFQRTSAPDVFCAGEPTGIGGLELSLIEGQIAGLAAAGRVEDAAKLFRSRARLQRFKKRLDHAFALRPELKKPPQPATIVCRCEDVTYGTLSQYRSWRAAKLQTRCGMGPCQGRVCGPATEFLLGWTPDSVRPPVFPARLQSLGTIRDIEPAQHQSMRGTQ